MRCFFCEGDGDHRELHAYPTRRPSNLPPAALAIQAHCAPGARRASTYPGTFIVEAQDDVVNKLRRIVDRKSTRLNSSHANISYAVFCLKKKISLLPFFILPLPLPNFSL